MNTSQPAANLIANILWSGIAALSLMCFHAPGHAAGFDCQKASTQAETLICSDKVLSSFDSRLDAAYRSALKYPQEPADRTSLFQTQKKWIKATRDACRDITCLRDVYRERISVVNRAVARKREACVKVKDFSDCTGVYSYRDANAKNYEFTEALASIDQPGAIENCQILVEIRHGFGGYCILKNGNARQRVKICQESMTGRSFIEPNGKSRVTTTALIEYTKNNCFGG